jgi:hypothetical protein
MTIKVVSFKPAGPVEAKWRRSRALSKVLLGPISSGKSTGAVSHLAELSMLMPPMCDGVVRARWCVVRNTYGALESATLKTINAVFPPELGTLIKSSPMRRDIKWPGFELELVLLALDNPAVSIKSALGTEFTGAWIDEGREVSLEIVQTLLGRIGRWPPRRELGQDYYAPLLITSNLSDTASWLYQWHAATPLGVEMFLQPSGLSPEHENKEGLPHPEWYKQQAQIVRPDYRRVMIEANWGTISYGDACVPNFNADLHVSREPLIVSPALAILVGLDAGPTHNPAAVVAQLDRGQLRVFDEWFKANSATLDAAQDFRQWLAARGYDKLGHVSIDPAATNQKDTMSGQFYVNAWRAILKNNNIRPAPTNSVDMRIEAARSIFSRLSDGRPACVIDPRCTHLIKALGGEWRFKQKHTPHGIIVSDDREIEKLARPFADLGDAFSYLVLASGEAGVLSAIANQRPGNRGATCAYCQQLITACQCKRAFGW